jgi:hypothetical protein
MRIRNLDNWNTQQELGSRPGIVDKPEISAVAVDNQIMDDGKSESGSPGGLSGGHEGFEQSFPDEFVDAQAVVRDDKFQPVSVPAGSYEHVDITVIMDNGVLNQLGDRLRDGHEIECVYP